MSTGSDIFPGLIKAVESILSEPLSYIFNINLCSSETFVTVSWMLPSWGLPAQDGTMQAAVISVIVQPSTFQTYLLYLLAHAVGPTDPNRATTRPRRWAVCLCLARDFECIRVLEPTSRPVLHHVVPSCQTHQHSDAGTFENPPLERVQIEILQLLSVFLFFNFACVLYRLMMQKSIPIFFSLLIIQYCNIFNIK